MGFTSTNFYIALLLVAMQFVFCPLPSQFLPKLSSRWNGLSKSIQNIYKRDTRGDLALVLVNCA